MAMSNVRTVDLLEKGHPFRQWKTWKIPSSNLTLCGYSRAADKTFFVVPELKACFDAGLCEGKQMPFCFLTHTHDDHAWDIEYVARRREGADIYCPAEAVDAIERYIIGKREMNSLELFSHEYKTHTLHGVRGGDLVDFGKNYRFKTIECHHKVASRGYAIYEKRNRLKSDLAQLQMTLSKAEFGAEIVKRKKAGEETTEPYDSPLFAYVLDTHASVWASVENSFIFEFPVVVTECTFIAAEDLERADKNGHTHWQHLLPVVAAHPSVLWVLVHFSLRHSDQDIVEFFREQCETHNLSNVVVWASEKTAMREQHQSSSKIK